LGLNPLLQRVVVVGTSCCGKSVFSHQLARALGCPRVELDELFWGPEWTPKPGQEFRRLIAAAAAAPRWVAEGNYGSIRGLLWPRATTIIWLNYGFPTVFFRALRRTLRRSITGETLWHGNRESLARSFFSRDSILVWVATTFHRRRRELNELRAGGNYPQVTWVEFRRPSDAARYLRSLQGLSTNSAQNA
jgi:adenylate kinase family enzyme